MNIHEFTGITLGNQSEQFYRFVPVHPESTGNYYFLSNDVAAQHFYGKKKDPHVVWGVANPHFFHVLSMVQHRRTIKRIIAIDSNKEQVVHFARLFELIITSSDRCDYLQRLFKVSFNSCGKSLLATIPPDSPNHVRGGVNKDSQFKLEKDLWGNCEFDIEAFKSNYALNARRDENGLRIQANTIGDINEYYATFACSACGHYPVTPFTAAYGSGFLRDDLAFKQMQLVLQAVPVYVLVADICDVYQDIIYSNRYEPLLFWSSNLFCDYFIKKHPPLLELTKTLELLGTQNEPHFPEIELTVIQDQREKRSISDYCDDHWRKRRKLSVHSRNFRRIVKHVNGFNNAEIVNVEEWIIEDKGVSKLPNTKYLKFQEFMMLGSDYCFDTLIMHILVGHGVSKQHFAAALHKARVMTRKLIILEHNKDSTDFHNSGIGMAIDEIRAILGQESFLDFGPGKRCNDRNLIMVYIYESASHKDWIRI